LNKDRFEISLIQPVSQSSLKVIDNRKICTNAKIASDINYSDRPCCPLPKLMSLNVKPTVRLEKILNDLLQKLFEEKARKSKYIFNSFSSNDLSLKVLLTYGPRQITQLHFNKICSLLAWPPKTPVAQLMMMMSIVISSMRPNSNLTITKLSTAMNTADAPILATIRINTARTDKSLRAFIEKMCSFPMLNK
jgi:hypothetical protein